MDRPRLRASSGRPSALASVSTGSQRRYFDRLLTAACLCLLAGACGGGGGGAVLSTPGPQPGVDAAVRGTGAAGDVVHVYRDVLAGPVSGRLPDVRVGLPANAAFMAFTGTHLLVASDFGVPIQNRFFVYGPADLAAMPPSPSVQVLIPPPAGMTGVSMKAFLVHDGDVYVLSVYDDGAFPVTLRLVTHVFRDLATLVNGSTPDATVTHQVLVTSGLLAAHESLAVDDRVLLATGFGNLFLHLAPDTLAGAEVPDRTLALVADLDASSTARVALGGGEAYVYGILVRVDAFGDPAGLVAGTPRRFRLQGPSQVAPGPNALLRLGGRLFTRGPYSVSPVGVVGFDVAGPVADYAPPDAALGPPVVGDQRLAGAGDVLLAGAVNGGVVAGFARASTLAGGASPDFYLYDPELVGLAEIHAALR